MTITRNSKKKEEVKESPSAVKREGFFYKKIEDNYEPEYKSLVKTGSGRVLEKKKHVEEIIKNRVEDAILRGDLSTQVIEAEEDLTHDEMQDLYNESMHHFERGQRIAKKHNVEYPEKEMTEKKFKLNVIMGNVYNKKGKNLQALSYYAKASNTSEELYAVAKKENKAMPEFESDKNIKMNPKR